MLKTKKENFINENIPHESGIKHVSGKAFYTDDIPEPSGTLFGAIGWSKKAHAIIKKINLDEVIKSEGVIAVVTSEDIEGRNDVGPVYDGDPIFPKKAEYYGQPLFAVAAKTTELARKAILKAKISYKTLKTITTIKEALKKKSYVLKEKIIKKGEALKAIENSANRMKGNFTTGSQEHFALEGQTAFVIPQEDNDYKIFSSTQHPSETQQIIAKMLNQKSNTITVETRRIGGGFGGKETQSFIFAAICTLLAKKTKQPVKLRMDRDDDIIITGKRHDFYSEYEVGFDELGIIKGLKLKLASRCGSSPDLSGAINERALLHIDNAYYLENIIVENYLCKTNTASNTAFRGFGGNQGMMAIENIIDNIANSLKKDPAEIRRRNFYQKKKKNITHYNMKVEDNVIHEIFDQILKSSNYKKRQLSIKKFNQENKYIKKGIAVTPVKFGISFTTWHLNQAGALVHIYCNDGSVHVSSGAIEMGQGTFTKIAQLAANELGIPFEKVKITSTRTDKVPNTSASAASSTTDLNGAATLNAISKIKINLAAYVKRKYKIKNSEGIYENGVVKFKGKTFKFNSLIKEAYLNRVSLSSSGFYATPKIHFDKKNFTGRPFLYFAYGAAVSEVMIDILTGENKIIQADILHDAGKAINPAIELGQIEGGFVQGAGWLTMEEVNWKSNGQITTHSPSTYKIPAVSDMPEKFNVEIFKKGKNIENVINKSKTTGEPPLMNAMSVFFAIKNAIASIANYNLTPELNAPATPERILMSINKLKRKI
ncbi:xanthine dehydrogenase molybdopterin binding subunit [Pelagibacteraceae bacterium]|jgi:xanthine dehydrogenase large subunit|nr:xanthine dehydrogenase molybdopterin binding subunit [Pelagibacteraceae bacterium]